MESQQFRFLTIKAAVATSSFKYFEITVEDLIDGYYLIFLQKNDQY